jgi:two-component system response regulator QseB
VRHKRLLVVSGDDELIRPLSALLDDAGHEFDLARDGQAGLDMGATRAYDLMIVDRGLPVLDCLEMIKWLRRKAVTARILVLTTLDDPEVLDRGADDYLIKPFLGSVLLTRLRALRRKHIDCGETFPLGHGQLDVRRYEVIMPRGGRIALSEREFDLLRTLAARPRVIYPRDELHDRVFTGAEKDAVVDRYVSYLRQKLGPGVVRTVWRVGYQIGTL